MWVETKENSQKIKKLSLGEIPWSFSVDIKNSPCQTHEQNFGTNGQNSISSPILLFPSFWLKKKQGDPLSHATVSPNVSLSSFLKTPRKSLTFWKSYDIISGKFYNIIGGSPYGRNKTFWFK